MTIDERVDTLMRKSAITVGAQIYREKLRTALQEVARDQRLACAETIQALPVMPDALNGISKYKAHQAVMNATIR